MSRWKKDFDPTIFIYSLQSEIQLNKNGAVSSILGSDIELDYLFWGVDHNFDFHEDITFQLFQRSLAEYFEKQIKTPKSLLQIFDRLCISHAKKKEKFVILTTVSLPKETELKSRTINKCHIRFSDSFPKKFRDERLNILSKAHTGIPTKEATRDDYLSVSITVTAPDDKTALHYALDALRFYRGIFEIFFKRQLNIISQSKAFTYDTRSKMRTGRFHTVHKKNQPSPTYNLWIEDDYLDCPTNSYKDIDKLNEIMDVYFVKLRRLPFKNLIEKSLKAYISALDQDDPNARFLKIWSAFEVLLDSDSTPVLVRRIAFINEDYSTAKVKATLLRDLRNKATHKGENPKNAAIKNFELCVQFDHMARFYINNPIGFTNSKDLLDFLSTTTDEKTIDQQMSNLRKVKAFIKKINQ